MTPTITATEPTFDAKAITRPAAQLLYYYVLVALLTLPAAILVLPVLVVRYMTLRYRFDDEAVSMRVGFLFRKEVLLTYRRIQDIHLTRNLVQRWFGLATVSVQTASGSAGPEMKIEGVLEADELRDFLYEKMRGAKGETLSGTGANGALERGTVTALLTEIRDNLIRVNAGADSTGERTE